MKQLLPICLFVITQHAYFYMEILGIKFFTFSAAITIIMSGLVSSFFLIYTYAVVINGLGKQFYIRDENHLNSIKNGFRRLFYVEKVAKEAKFLGLGIVNFVYLLIWVVCAFGLLRWVPGMFSYFVSSLAAGMISLGIAEQVFGIDD